MGHPPSIGTKLDYSRPDKQFGTVRRHIEMQHMLTTVNGVGGEFRDPSSGQLNSQYRISSPSPDPQKNWQIVENINNATLATGGWRQEGSRYVFEKTFTPGEVMTAGDNSQFALWIGDGRYQMTNGHDTLVHTNMNRLVLDKNCNPITSYPVYVQ